MKNNKLFLLSLAVLIPTKIASAHFTGSDFFVHLFLIWVLLPIFIIFLALSLIAILIKKIFHLNFSNKKLLIILILASILFFLIFAWGYLYYHDAQNRSEIDSFQEIQQTQPISENETSKINSSQEKQPISENKTVDLKTYSNDKFRFKFQYPNNYNVEKLDKQTGFEKWQIKIDSQSVMNMELTNWQEYVIEEGTPGTFYEEIARDNWKYFVDNIDKIKSGNCTDAIKEHVSGLASGDSPKLCIVENKIDYIKIETENSVSFYTNDSLLSFESNDKNKEKLKNILATFELIKKN